MTVWDDWSNIFRMYVRINTYIARAARDNNAVVLLRRRFEVALLNAAVTRQSISEEYESIISANT